MLVFGTVDLFVDYSNLYEPSLIVAKELAVLFSIENCVIDNSFAVLACSQLVIISSDDDSVYSRWEWNVAADRCGQFSRAATSRAKVSAKTNWPVSKIIVRLSQKKSSAISRAPAHHAIHRDRSYYSYPVWSGTLITHVLTPPVPHTSQHLQLLTSSLSFLIVYVLRSFYCFHSNVY